MVVIEPHIISVSANQTVWVIAVARRFTLNIPIAGVYITFVPYLFVSET